MSKLEQLKKLIMPYVLSKNQLIKQGKDLTYIRKYTSTRTYLWNKAVLIFKQIFKHLGKFNVMKDYDSDNECMRVRVYTFKSQLTTPIEIETYDEDPIVALVECANRIEKSDEFIEALLKNLSIKD